MRVRDATPSDAPAIADIYRHHVAYGTASYDFDAPPVDAWVERLAAIAGCLWPFVVAEVGGQVAGYAYATQMRDRAGYRYSCEDSIYIHTERQRQGVGLVLLGRLVDLSTEAGFRQMVAVIGGAEPGSIALHRSLGFREVGPLPAIGYKFGRWLDSVYMQRALGEDERAE